MEIFVDSDWIFDFFETLFLNRSVQIILQYQV
jgi:hypothetical protein